MSKKLYIGGLTENVTEDQLREFVTSAGVTVETVSIIMSNDDRSPAVCRGFGFVEIAVDAEEEMQKAISQLDGKEFLGKTTTVNEARPMAPRSDRR